MSDIHYPPRGSHSLLCPVCMVPLKEMDIDGIETDCCPQCRGIWLDRGELDKMIQRSIVVRPVEPQYPDHP